MSAMSDKNIEEKNKGETLWQWAERFADLKERWREVVKELKVSEDAKDIERLKMEKRTLEARIEAIRKKRNGLVSEIIHNNEEKPHRSEVEGDGYQEHLRNKEAEDQENFRN